MPSVQPLQVLLVDLQYQLDIAFGREHHEHLTRLHTIASLDIARHDNAINRCGDTAIAQTCLRSLRCGLRLAQAGFGTGGFRAGRLQARPLVLRDGDLRLSQVQGALRLFSGSSAIKALGIQLLGTRRSALRAAQIELRLRHGLIG